MYKQSVFRNTNIYEPFLMHLSGSTVYTFLCHTDHPLYLSFRQLLLRLLQTC